MNSTAKTFRTCGKTMLMATLLLASVPAIAAEYWLRAEATTVTMPDSNVVSMWGFAECTANHAVCAAATVPGPALDVPAGDTTGLTVHLNNTLTKPVSLVINGQMAMMTPVWADGTSGSRTNRTQRVRSFTHEAAPNGGNADYSWPVIKSGTYLYQSGTHPQVQVQMGLYGALTSDAATSQPYTGSATYDSALTLLFSEIDPALHAAVTDGTYGNVSLGGPTSTLDYDPKYLLINGKAFESGDVPLATLTEGDTVLLRLLNAGLQSRAPMISNGHIRVIAEDGNLYPWAGNPRQQYSVFLPAAKTIDALYVAQGIAGQDARIAIYDRRLALTNNAALDGGMMGFMEVNLIPAP